jgi:hypothetical protein
MGHSKKEVLVISRLPAGRSARIAGQLRQSSLDTMKPDALFFLKTRRHGMEMAAASNDPAPSAL